MRRKEEEEDLHPFGSVLADEREFGGGLGGDFAAEAPSDDGRCQSRRSDRRSPQVGRH